MKVAMPTALVANSAREQAVSFFFKLAEVDISMSFKICVKINMDFSKLTSH